MGIVITQRPSNNTISLLRRINGRSLVETTLYQRRHYPVESHS